MTLKDVRCCACHRLLFRASDLTGTVEIKCPRCRAYNILRPQSPSPERPDRAERLANDPDTR